MERLLQSRDPAPAAAGAIPLISTTSEYEIENIPPNLLFLFGGYGLIIIAALNPSSFRKTY
jgi:hypothetical protein